jgi:hypothetical protein
MRGKIGQNFSQAIQSRAKEVAKNGMLLHYNFCDLLTMKDSVSTEGEDSLDIESFEEEDVDLDLPNVPREEPGLGDSSASSSSSSSSFTELVSQSKLIPFEMSEDSEEDLMLDSEDESDDSGSYEKLSSGSFSTQGSSLEFSHEESDQSDDVESIVSVYIGRCISNASDLRIVLEIHSLSTAYKNIHNPVSAIGH